MQFYEFKDIEERVILIGVQTSEDEDVAASLDELEELAETAGAETVAKVIQNREAVHRVPISARVRSKKLRHLFGI